MFPSPSLTSSFSRQSRPRHARAKVASGGLRGYTGFKVFEKPGSTRDFSLFEKETRQSSALAQTGIGGTFGLFLNSVMMGLSGGSGSGTPFTIAYSPYLLDSDTKGALQGLGANPGVSVSEIKTQADLSSLAKNAQGNVLLMGHASDGHFYGSKGQALNVPSEWAASAVALAGCKTSVLASQLQQHGSQGTTFYLYPGRLPLGLLTAQLQSTNPRSFGYYGLSGLIKAWDSGVGRTYPAQELRRTDSGLQLRDISVRTQQWMEVGQ